MEEPKSPLSDSYYSPSGTLSPVHSVDDSQGSGRSGTPGAAKRLSDRIRHRLDRRSNPRTGGPPLSPRSDASYNSGTFRSTSYGSTSTAPTRNTSSSVHQRRNNRNRSYEDRVNLLLTKGSEEEEESVTRVKSASPTSAADPPITMESIANGIIANISIAERPGRDSDSDASTNTDDSSQSSNTSSSTDDAMSTVGSGDSFMSGAEGTGRSFSPIYEGIQDPIGSPNNQESNDADDDEGFDGVSGDLSAEAEPESRDPSDGEKMDNPPNSAYTSPGHTAEASRPASFSFYQPSTPSPAFKRNPPKVNTKASTPKRGARTTSRSPPKQDDPAKPDSGRYMKHSDISTDISEDPSKDESAATSLTGTPSKGSPTNRQRVPGGAAAKVMLVGPRKSDDNSSSDDEEPGAIVVTKQSSEADVQNKTMHEISSTIIRARSEFTTGGEQNRRYNPTIKEGDEGSQPGDAQWEINNYAVSALPKSALFNRTQIFHKDANAAIAALLTPRSGLSDGTSVMSVDVQSVVSGSTSAVSSAFQAPRPVGSGEQPSAVFESLARRDVSLRLITEETERRLEKLKDTMLDPNKTLADLLTAIHTKEDENPDLGFTVRRKNACGALQLMTAQAENRVPIAWTVGVLPALTSVLRDTGDEGVHITYPDRRHRLEFEAARDRAIACLMNLSMPPKNRIAIFHTPQLVQWLIVVINEGHGLSRKGSCAVLAYLGKTPENRLLMAKVPGLLDALEKVLKPRPPRVERVKVVKRTKQDGSDSEKESEDEGRPEEGIVTVSSSYSNESEKTTRFNGSHVPVEIHGYDETADALLRAARQNVFALLIHLVKEKDNAYHFARHDALMATLAAIANYHESASHLLSIKILAATTRHKLNTKTLVFKQREVVPALVKGTKAMDDSTRLYSCYALQNLAQDKSCRQELAVAKDLISALCDRSRKAKPGPERLAAISAIKNLCDEPANLIPMTNTPDCIATLMHLAHGMEDGITELMKYRACDALATLSHWLRKIATSGQALENSKAKKPPPKSLFVPSLQVIPYNQWK